MISWYQFWLFFFPNDNQESHWPRKVLIRAPAHNIPLKYYKSRDQLPGNHQGGRDWFRSQRGRYFAGPSLDFSLITGAYVGGDMIASYLSPPGPWLVPGWSLAGLWLVISPHRLSQCVPVSESRCDGVWHWTQQTENCHHHHHHHHLPPSSCCWNVPEAVRPWGELFVFKDTREAPGLGTPSVVLTCLSCPALTAGQQGHHGSHGETGGGTARLN